jgi:general secretion pathway protein I
MAQGGRRDEGGFTLLEVLLAFAILSIAVVTLIELTSQGLRLLKVSGDHQQAVQIADRLARDTQIDSENVPTEPVIESGEEGTFAWERRIVRLPLPEEIEPATPVPGKELPGLYTVSVAVRWGRDHVVEVATLRAPAPVTSAGASAGADQQGGQTQGGTPQGTTPGSGQTGSESTSGSGRSGTGSGTSSSKSGTSSSSSSSRSGSSSKSSPGGSGSSKAR